MDLIKIKQMAGVPLTEAENIASLLSTLEEGTAGAYLVLNVDLNEGSFDKEVIQWDGKSKMDLARAIMFDPNYKPTEADRDEIADLADMIKPVREGWMAQSHETQMYIITQI